MFDKKQDKNAGQVIDNVCFCLVTRSRLQNLVMIVAELRREMRQTENGAGVDNLPELLPPLRHDTVAELEERFAVLRAAASGFLAAVRCHFQNLSCSEL